MADDRERLIQQLRKQLSESKLQLQKTIQNNESYQAQSKQLQQFLENEIKKKDGDIKKLKQQYNKRQKQFSESKSKFAQYERQLNNKNKIIAQLNQKFQKNSKQLANITILTNKFQKQIQQLTNKINKKNEQIAYLQQKIKIHKQNLQKLTRNQQHLNKCIQQKQSQINQLKKIKNSNSTINLRQINTSTHSNDQLKKLKQQINRLKKRQGSNIQLSNLKIENQKLYNQIESLQNQLHVIKNANTLHKTKSKPIIEIMPQNQQYRKLERAYKQMKIKYTQITEQKKYLLKTLRQFEKKYQDDLNTHRDQLKNQQIIQDKKRQKQNFFYVLVKTKRHYISPFLEINGKNLKLLKQTKSGFQKSLGHYKFGVDSLFYDVNQISQNLLDSINIEKWKQKQDSDTIIIHGQKKSSKKDIFIHLINGLKQRISKIVQEGQQIHIKVRIYKSKLGDAPIIDKQYDTNNQQQSKIGLILTNIIQLVQKNKDDMNSPKKIKLIAKNKSKQQLRILQIHINQSYTLDIITSNNYNGFKDNDSLGMTLNNLIYQHIPFNLSNQSKKYIVLPINPIVQHYDNCRLSLQLINQQYKIDIKKQDYIYNENAANMSPIKQQMMINQSIKKKLQLIQKQNEQFIIKIQKLEQQCFFYRNKIEQFVVRIKNIISTQNKQNTYLKKSPITLTLEKLQRSMIIMLQRNLNNRISAYERQKMYEVDNLVQEYEQTKENEDNVL